MLHKVIIGLDANMRRMRKQPIGHRNDWNHDLEIGDRVYTWVEYKKTAVIDDLVESSGHNKAASGELTPRRIVKNRKCRIATRKKNGIWYWID